MSHLPPFNDEGDLPPGVYPATLAELVERFGQGTARRRAVADRLIRIHELARSTGHLVRCVVFGSFVTDKPDPNDVDLILVLDDTFNLAAVKGEAALIFSHAEADSHFGASIFWVRRLAALGGEQAMVEYWQTRREGGRRGIVEIVESTS